jgi:hypothetical protein
VGCAPPHGEIFETLVTVAVENSFYWIIVPPDPTAQQSVELTQYTELRKLPVGLVTAAQELPFH